MKNLVFLFFFIFFFNSCNKECNELTDYVFELPATLNPAKDTFLIGDTITITSEFPNKVFDKSTKKYYKLENWKFFLEIRLREISDTISNEAALLDFEVLIDSIYNFAPLQYSNGSVSYVGDYLYSEKNYSLKYSLIPKKIGLYYHSLFSLLFDFGKNQDFDGRCPKGRAGVDAFIRLNGNEENNINMLLTSPDKHFNDWILQKPETRFYKFGGYCFYVK